MYRNQQDAAKAPEGVGVAIADFGDRQSLLGALDGIDCVYLVCGPIPQLVELESNMIDACRTAGVRYVVPNSALGADTSRSPSRACIPRSRRSCGPPGSGTRSYRCLRLPISPANVVCRPVILRALFPGRSDVAPQMAGQSTDRALDHRTIRRRSSALAAAMISLASAGSDCCNARAKATLPTIAHTNASARARADTGGVDADSAR